MAIENCACNAGKLLKLIRYYNVFLLLVEPAMSVLQAWYMLAGSRKRLVIELKDSRIKLLLLVAQRLIINIKNNEASKMSFYAVIKASREQKYFAVRFSALSSRKKDLSNNYNWITHNFNVQSVLWKLISRKNWKCKMNISFVESRAALLKIRFVMHYKAYSEHCIIILTDS